MMPEILIKVFSSPPLLFHLPVSSTQSKTSECKDINSSTSGTSTSTSRTKCGPGPSKEVDSSHCFQSLSQVNSSKSKHQVRIQGITNGLKEPSRTTALVASQVCVCVSNHSMRACVLWPFCMHFLSRIS